MTSRPRSLLSLWNEPPRPWHLLLIPAIPLLGLLKDALVIVPPTVFLVPYAAGVTVSLLAALLILPIGAERHRSALAVSLLVLTGLSYMTVALPVTAIAGKAAVVVLHVILVLGAFMLIRRSGSAAALTVTANRAVALTVLLLAVPILWSEGRRPRTRLEPFELPAALASYPDVYVIVLDGYAREDVLRDVYGFENGLVRELRATNFFVADRASANYSQTALSLASALNADYLPTLNPAVRHRSDRRGLGDLINDSRFFRAFIEAGYWFRAYSTEYALVKPRGTHDRPSPGIHLNDFSYTVYETTILPTLLNAAGLERGAVPLSLHRRHITWTLDHLAQKGPHDARPLLTFAHVLAPHPPFAFDANGRARHTFVPALLGDGDHWQRLAARTGESYKSGYVDTLRALNTQLTATLRTITNRNRQSVVLVHGDHGPGAGLEWERPDRTDLRERLAVLAAVRFPPGEVPRLDPDTTLVNVYRAVLNRALGTSLRAIEDRSYHSTWERPFEFIDVTGQVNLAAK